MSDVRRPIQSLGSMTRMGISASGGPAPPFEAHHGSRPSPEACDEANRYTLWLEFERSVAVHASREACVFGDLSIGYTRLHDWAAALAAGLIHLCNVGPGEKMVLLAGNRPEWLPLSLAVQGAAAVEVPCRPDLSDAELFSLLSGVDAVVAIVETTLIAERIISHSSELPQLRRIIVIEPDETQKCVLSLTSVEAAGRRILVCDPGLLSRQQWRIGTDSPAAVIHTSGTTGPPKAALLSHGNLLHSQHYLPGAIGLTQDDRILLCLPLWHLYGRLMAYVAIASGASMHFGSFERLDEYFLHIRPSCFPAFPPIWERIHRRCLSALNGRGIWTQALHLALKVSRLHLQMRDLAFSRTAMIVNAKSASRMSASVWGALAEALLFLPARLARSVLTESLQRRVGPIPRLGIVGDAPLPRGVDEDLRAMGFNVLEGYGSTEQVVSSIRRPGRNPPGTIGEPLPQVEMRVLGDRLERLPRGEIGQFAVAGPQVCLGYQADATLNAAAFVMIEGRRFFLTGDIGWCDAQGQYVFVGRLSNAMRSSDGMVMYPEVVENLLRDSPFIEQALIYPRSPAGFGVLVVPDRDRLQLAMEEPTAFLRREINRILESGGLAAQPCPSHFIVASHPFQVGDALTPTLKLRREAIRTVHCTPEMEHSL